MDNNNAFLTKTSEEKIEDIISSVKQSLMQGDNITPVFYLFDQNDKLHVIEIKEPSLLKKDRSPVLMQLIREKVKDMKSRDLQIEQLLFLREGYYNRNHPNKNSMNLEEDFNKNNADEALIITVEDGFNINLRVYDMINIHDDGKKFTVLSENPIDEIDYCKIDPEYNLKANYINILS